MILTSLLSQLNNIDLNLNNQMELKIQENSVSL